MTMNRMSSELFLFLPCRRGEADRNRGRFQTVCGEAHALGLGLQTVDSDEHCDRLLRWDECDENPAVLRDIHGCVVVDPCVLHDHVCLRVKDLRNDTLGKVPGLDPMLWKRKEKF